MKKIIIWIVILAAIVLVLSLIFKDTKPHGLNTGQVSDEEFTSDEQIVTYFQEAMVTGATNDIGPAKEGYDDTLLRTAYPGLIASDFQGVETFEGHYEVSGDTVSFVRDAEEPVSSAERTVSKDGYYSLLSNLVIRLKMSAGTKTDIQAIINRINTSERIKVMLNQKGEFLNVKITPTKVLEDSRCPVDVQCIQAGTVRVETVLETSMGNSNQVFELNKSITTESETITLVNVDPVKEANKIVGDADYLFYFEIKQRSQSEIAP